MKKAGIFLMVIFFIFTLSCKDKKLNEQNEMLKKQIQDLKLTVMQYEKLAQNIQFLINQKHGW